MPKKSPEFFRFEPPEPKTPEEKKMLEMMEGIEVGGAQKEIERLKKSIDVIAEYDRQQGKNPENNPAIKFFREHITELQKEAEEEEGVPRQKKRKTT